MIISHRHKFIFLKTNKTAGTSIEIALSKFCGPDDIITPISPEDEETRQHLGYPGPQNYPLPFSSYNLYDLARLVFRQKRKQFYNHMSGKEVKAYIGEEVWNNYYKFCVERNPWDRCISLYYWRHKTEPRPSFAEFLNSRAPRLLKMRGFNVYTIKGEVAVDRICRFENLNDELEEVRKQVGIPEPLELPRAKSTFRKDKRHYKDVLTNNDIEKIAELFRDEINLLGYTR